MKPQTINCPCGKSCGKQYYPATFDSRGEPGYSEGIGEDFSLHGVWHCSEQCLDDAKAREPSWKE
jgi:hypothetical protein